MLEYLWRKLIQPHKPAKRRTRPPGADSRRPLVCEPLEERWLLSTTITESAVPTASAAPFGITAGPDGNLWFTETAGNKIGSLNPSTHAITEYPIPTPSSDSGWITLGPDGNLWFTESNGNQIASISPATHAITEYPIPTANSFPFGIQTAPDGNLWFTELVGNQIGMINPTTHAVTEFAVPTASSQPLAITAGPDGNLWFTESSGNQIGMINPTTKAIAEYAIPTTASQPLEITAGADGNLWFAEAGANNIASINPATHAVTEYPVPTASSLPAWIRSNADGTLWFSETNANQIGSINPATHTFTETPIPTAGSSPGVVAPGPNGTVWFAETKTNQIGEIVTSTSVVANLANQTIDAGQNATFTVPVPAGVSPGVQWLVSTNGHTFTSLSNNATYSGVNTNTLTISGATLSMSGYQFKPFFSNGATTTAATLTVNPALGMTPSLSQGTAGAIYNRTIQVTGGTAPYALFAPSFDPGSTGLVAAEISVNALLGTVTIAGPVLPGTATLLVSVTDATGAVLAETYTITINPPLGLPSSLPAAAPGASYNQSLQVTGGTPLYNVAVTAFDGGTTGLTADEVTVNPLAGTVTVQGTPTANGTATFTVNVTDAAGATLASNITLPVNPGMSITPSIPGGGVGAAYNQTITVTDGTTPYTAITITGFDAGTTGLTASAITTNVAAGTITVNGTPTASGTATFTVNVADSGGATLTQTYTIDVTNALTISDPTLTQWTAGTPGFTGSMTVNGGTGPFSLSDSSGLPTGLTAVVNGSTISFTGSSSSANTFANGSVTIQDAAGTSVTKNFSVTINPALSVTSSLPAGTAGVGYSQTITVTGGTGPYKTLAVNNFQAGATTFTGAELATNAAAGTITFNGMSSTAGTATFTVTVTDSAGATLSKTISIAINPAPGIGSLSVAQWTVGMPGFTGSIPFTLGAGPYTITSSSGLPTGLTAVINGHSIRFTGAPGVAGTFANGNVIIRDAAGGTVNKHFSITISPAPSITPSLPSGTAKTNYNQTITVQGGLKPYTTFAVTNFSGGTTGLTSSAITTNATAGTINIHGTPTAAGTITFTVNVVDTAGARLTRTFKIAINAATVPTSAPTISNLTTTQGTTGKSGFTGTMTITGGTGPFKLITSTGLPTGLTATLSGRAISFTGSPTTLGTFSHGSVTIRDAAGKSVTKTFSITIISTLSITSSLPQGTARANYNQTITVTGGVKPYTTFVATGFSGGNTGLTANAITTNATTGKITVHGTPAAAGTIRFTVRVVDKLSTTLTKTFSITINAVPTISNLTVTQWTAGKSGFTGTMTIKGGTGPFTIIRSSGLPTGLTATVNGQKISLTGTPTVAKSFVSGSITLRDAAGAVVTKTFRITINPSLVISPTSLPAGVVGVSYSATVLAKGGTGSATFALSKGSLPTGLGLNRNGKIRGVPKVTGTFSFTVTATDAVGATVSQKYTLSVAKAAH